MTKKDYELLARTFKAEIETAESQYEPIGAAALRSFADVLSARLADDNPRFDRLRFLRAADALVVRGGDVHA